VKKILLILSLFISLNVVGQGEAANWYFGYGAGMQFDLATGNTTTLNDGQLSTNEGCSTISDANGNLLFYSDGITVWNRNHQVMPNGNGLFGDPSSTQSALVVPKPEDPDIYYIFTIDVRFGAQLNGFNFSVIDMSLDGGLGDVIDKNMPLLSSSSEKISAVLKDCVKKSIWVITFASLNGDTNIYNTFHAFEVNNSGVNTTAVISTFNTNINDARGYLKLSPDGTKLVNANMSGGLFLYDFDENTGVVTNEQQLIINSQSNAPYGVEFSPNSQILYVHSSNDSEGAAINHSSVLTQFNLAIADIQASEFELDGRQLYRGGLQLGPNGKIYRALSATYTQGLPFLGVINNPNNIGAAANYQHDAISLSPNLSSQGFPPFIQSIFNTEIDIIRNGLSVTNLLLCDGDTYMLIADDIVGATYSWTLDGNPLAEIGTNLVVTQAGVYQVFIDPNNGDCAIEGEATVSYFTPPIANQPANINVCDDDNDSFFMFDFTVDVDVQVLGAQDPSTFSVHYFESQIDADSNINEIVMPYQNLTNSQEMFARINNDGFIDCFDTTSFFIEIFDTPTITPFTDYQFCDDTSDGDNMNGQTTVDLLEIDALVLGNQDPLLYNITYHSSQFDANSGAAALPFTYYNTIPNLEVIFVRIENITNTDCYDTMVFDLIVNVAPETFNTTLFQCDEDGNVDGFTTFNLTEANGILTGGIVDRSTKFFLSLAAAQATVNEIDGNAYGNITNPQTIHVQVINDNTGCFDFAELILEVSTTNAFDASLFTCDDDGIEDGFYTFNLSDADVDVLNGLTTDLTINYYETYNDALLEQNPLPLSYVNIIPYSHSVFVRVEDDNACFGINQVQLTVFEIPDIEIEEQLFYCLNVFPQTITLNAGLINNLSTDFTYSWSTGEITSEIQINQTGTYSVTVTNVNGCSKERTITVLPSNIATIASIEVTDTTQNNTITVTVSGEGIYVFALDNSNGSYQESNFFDNVAPGLHTVYVKDTKNNCGIVEEIVSVIGFPLFFTPNNDSYNDTWQVYGLSSQFQPNSIIYIYDRYGKLLKQLDPSGPGWDGTFNGKRLPNSDYWFHVTLEDGRTFRSHFTLKR
jgi:gliding motility-associated-like protein